MPLTTSSSVTGEVENEIRNLNHFSDFAILITLSVRVYRCVKDGDNFLMIEKSERRKENSVHTRDRSWGKHFRGPTNFWRGPTKIYIHPPLNSRYLVYRHQQWFIEKGRIVFIGTISSAGSLKSTLFLIILPFFHFEEAETKFGGDDPHVPPRGCEPIHTYMNFVMALYGRDIVGVCEKRACLGFEAVRISKSYLT